MPPTAGTGHETLFEHTLTPTEVLQDMDIQEVCAGEQHSLALTQSGSVYTFGCGLQGQLGIGIAQVCMYACLLALNFSDCQRTPLQVQAALKMQFCLRWLGARWLDVRVWR